MFSFFLIALITVSFFLFRLKTLFSSEKSFPSLKYKSEIVVLAFLSLYQSWKMITTFSFISFQKFLIFHICDFQKIVNVSLKHSFNLSSIKRESNPSYYIVLFAFWCNQFFGVLIKFVFKNDIKYKTIAFIFNWICRVPVF